MPLARRSSTRAARRNEIKDALENVTDPNQLHLLLKKAMKQISYNDLVKRLERKYLDSFLPAAKPADYRIINLRDCWIEASMRLHYHSLPAHTEQSLKKNGYLETMLGHLEPTGVGTGNFKKLKEVNALPLTSEYLMYNFFSNRLQLNTLEKIARCLDKNFCITPKHEVELLCKEGRLSEIFD